MAVFFWSYAFDRKNGHTVFYAFFSTTCRKHMGFIRVIYANDRKITAIRANTAKYGSLTEKSQPYGVPGYIYIYIYIYIYMYPRKRQIPGLFVRV